MKFLTTKFNLTLATFFLVSVFALNSCKPQCEKHPDDPECLGEEELITTLKVLVYDSATNASVGTFQFSDADNNGTPEIFDTIKLNANTTYRVALQFLNTSVAPAEDITTEIEAEKDEHLIVFHAHDVTVNFTYADVDDNNLPVGLSSYWRATTTGNGHIHIKLRHQPGVKDGTETPGDTDVEVEFPAYIQ